MSNAILPKEQQSAFERWEMRSFGDTRPEAQPVPVAPPPPKIGVEEIAAIREEARARGHAEGFAEGRAEGLAQGRAAAAAEMKHLRQVAEQLGEEATRADQAIANDVLELALDLAKAMLKTALTVRPELVAPIVSEAIRYLPSLQQPALLMLNPQDAAVIKAQMHDELEKAGWRIVEDGHIQRGGCRIDTATNQIDAGIDTRWQRLAEALGKQSEWLV
ncbi:flagellar assembly protein FliH [Janthinobacterium sp. 17J80-10]|uniref:flagellar assembly protein FliH n=1 Tax=Janthinobacterium sp. 17J80-10 TaxID=2497863 RepID=UPI0010055B73|nr:flagellar assembly protein FliH [Janthinobacterium sp. 17J80-10]QAU34364.1 flagellar assembly protein FliH [Janthinobacterium sp. 17J80-10]